MGVGMGVRAMVFQHHFQQYFSYIVAVSFIGGGNLITSSVSGGNHQPAASH